MFLFIMSFYEENDCMKLKTNITGKWTVGNQKSGVDEAQQPNEELFSTTGNGNGTASSGANLHLCAKQKCAPLQRR